MRILFNNIDFNSRSGPNGFGLKLANQFLKCGIDVVNHNPEVVLNFIQGNIAGYRNVLRLDGIYFNTDQDWKKQNSPILASYKLADAVVVQSEFNRELVLKYFGDRSNVHVINNGTNLGAINATPRAEIETHRDDSWLCASSWRPHKRLIENIRYFQKHAGEKAVLYVAGSGDISALHQVRDPRVKYVGDLTWKQLISLMKSCSNFVHLAYLDHCPNVVVDARASGCKVHCSSSGGTKEVAGTDSVLVLEKEWDFKPTKLYSPPDLDFTALEPGHIESDISMISVAKKYLKVLEG